MFLGIAIYETLDEHGILNSYFMTPPRGSSVLIADHVKEVNRDQSAGAVDVGPLRMYAAQEGIGFRFVSSRMSGSTFCRAGDEISVNLQHHDIPIPSGTAGYYGILMPKGFTGDVNLSIRVGGEEQARTQKVFLTDTNQLFVSSGFTVYADQRAKPHITLAVRLRNNPRESQVFEQSTFNESFGGYIDGLHDTAITAFIREINRNLGANTSQVFICHSSSDKAHARRLAHALAGQGIRVWIDEAEIRVGDSLIEKIENGILSSHNLIVVLTQNSVASRWCKEELRLALIRQIGGEKLRVLPALFETCDIPGFLREKAYADFRSVSEFSEKVKELADAIG